MLLCHYYRRLIIALSTFVLGVVLVRLGSFIINYEELPIKHFQTQSQLQVNLYQRKWLAMAVMNSWLDWPTSSRSDYYQIIRPSGFLVGLLQNSGEVDIEQLQDTQEWQTKLRKLQLPKLNPQKRYLVVTSYNFATLKEPLTFFLIVAYDEQKVVAAGTYWELVESSRFH